MPSRFALFVSLPAVILASVLVTIVVAVGVFAVSVLALAGVLAGVFEQPQRQHIGLRAAVQGLVLFVGVEMLVGFIREFANLTPRVRHIRLAVRLVDARGRAAAAAV